MADQGLGSDAFNASVNWLISNNSLPLSAANDIDASFTLTSGYVSTEI